MASSCFIEQTYALTGIRRTGRGEGGVERQKDGEGRGWGGETGRERERERERALP